MMSHYKLPEFILFAQHGMTDENQTIARLAHRLASDRALVVAPNLGYARTLLLIEPLIQTVNQAAIETLAQHPEIPVRIVATSLGGIIWLEVLHRHPEWWSRVHSLILLGSPVGGAHYARMVDPLGWGVGIARDLGKNRRSIAEKIARVIPTLVIAGEINGGDDGTVTIESTKFHHAHFVCLSGVNHPALRHHPSVASAIQTFWAEPRQPIFREVTLSDLLIQRLQAIEGMTDAHGLNSHKAKIWVVLKDGTSLRIWKSPLGIDYVFVSHTDGQCLYGGFVGWIHSPGLSQALVEIREELAPYVYSSRS